MALTDRQEMLAKILRESPHLIESRSIQERDTTVLRGLSLRAWSVSVAGIARTGRP
jgi:hypothetical protein